MPKDLPPLTALRAFEAAGRHLSITRAADELCVTAAAVSHQVKTLEDYLEVRLFRRTGNSLFLTDAGQAFLPGLKAGFAELERAMNALREHDLRGAFVLSVVPVCAELRARLVRVLFDQRVALDQDHRSSAASTPDIVQWPGIAATLPYVTYPLC
jgi:DNA-binding transcriptional LysR family regulator